MPGLAKWPNSDLSKGFSVPQIAQKHGWPEIELYHWELESNCDDFKIKSLMRSWLFGCSVYLTPRSTNSS